jgi:hypothetical protein
MVFGRQAMVFYHDGGFNNCGKHSRIYGGRIFILWRMSKNIPIDADAQTAKLNTAFGILLLISILIRKLV